MYLFTYVTKFFTPNPEGGTLLMDDILCNSQLTFGTLFMVATESVLDTQILEVFFHLLLVFQVYPSTCHPDPDLSTSSR